MQDFRKVAVLGAGVMGSGIAAHLAGAGLEVLLLDIVPPAKDGAEKATKPAERNAFASGALDKAMKSKPAAFFSQRDRERISVGNLEDDLAAAGKCDLIIEVVKEDLEVKRKLFARLEPLLDEHTILASNTSGLPINQMMEGRSASMKKRFLVMHFFNPVRYMKLLEIVAGTETDPTVVSRVAKFGDEVLGKGIVYGKDTPNFVANRIGVFAMMRLIHTAVQQGYTVEEVDAIFGPTMGRPKSAVFRTADLVGLDTVVHVAQNCYENLPHDEERETFRIPHVLTQMVEKKMLGDKTGGGFMKKVGKDIVALDLKTLEYRAKEKPRFPSIGAVRNIENSKERVKAFLSQPDDRAVTLARSVTLATLAYASNRVGEIADDLVNIDRGMRWGFGWDSGPFETWDAIGVENGVAEMKKLGIIPAPWVGKMLASGRKSFYDGTSYYDVKATAAKPVPTSARALDLSTLKLEKKERIFGNDGASLWDVGDGIALLEFHTKMNALDADVISMVHRSVDEAEKRFTGLVVGNQAKDAFSAGANLFLVLIAAQQKQWKQLEEMIGSLQSSLQRLKYAAVPTVTAPFGLALGGGAEVAMQGAACRANAELYMGLVEVGVGLIPAGGGCKELHRWPAASVDRPMTCTSASIAWRAASSGVANSGPISTSKPMSPKAEAITFWPRSCPSCPALATRILGRRPSFSAKASTSLAHVHDRVGIALRLAVDARDHLGPGRMAAEHVLQRGARSRRPSPSRARPRSAAPAGWRFAFRALAQRIERGGQRALVAVGAQLLQLGDLALAHVGGVDLAQHEVVGAGRRASG